MVFGPVTLGILQSSHFTSFNQSDYALVAVGVDVTVCQLRAVTRLLGVAQSLLPSTINVHSLLNLKVCLFELGLLSCRGVVCSEL